MYQETETTLSIFVGIDLRKKGEMNFTSEWGLYFLHG